MCAFHARTDKCNSRARTNAFQMCTQRPILWEQLQLHFQACTHNYASYVCIKYAFNPRTQSRFNFLNVHFNSSRIHADSRTVQAELPKTGSKEEASMPNALQLSEVKILHSPISWRSILVSVSSWIIASGFFVRFDVSRNGSPFKFCLSWTRHWDFGRKGCVLLSKKAEKVFSWKRGQWCIKNQNDFNLCSGNLFLIIQIFGFAESRLREKALVRKVRLVN